MAEPQSPSRILILFAHPALEKSRVNRRLVQAVQDTGGVTLHDLYERYPDFDIDVAREQELVEQHDVILFQHPFYWYSTPAILKEWQDLVLQYGWAFGHEGHALRGKRAGSVITVGGPETSYCAQGSNHHSMEQLLAPIEQTWALCGVEWLPPFLVYGTHDMSAAAMDAHAQSYRATLSALRDGVLDLDAARRGYRLNLPDAETSDAR
jgi:glutathione-regulated potassium-efflux system ancillary protein KefG